MKEKIVLVILDGWGYSDSEEGNAVLDADTKNMDRYITKYPSVLLEASGRAIGLPEGSPGFCEYAYHIIGTGKKTVWDNEKIMKEIRTGKFKKKLAPAMQGKRVHVFVPLSENGIYSHIAMLKEVLALARSKRKNIFVHLILEGRESGPHSSYDLFQKWKDDFMIKHLASVVGSRYVLNNNIESMVEEYLATLSEPETYFPSFVSAIMSGYDHGEDDFTMKPKVLDPSAELLDGDTALVLGYRSQKWDNFLEALAGMGLNVHMVSYFNKPRVNIIYKYRPVKDSFSEQLVSAKGAILKIGETEKRMDLEYFFTGGKDIGESRIFPSPRTLDYSVTPEMASPEVTGETLKAIKDGKHDLIVASFAAPDVIAHTGNYESLIRALEVVDDGVGRIVRAAQKEGYVSIIVGDHGNAEEMYKDGKVFLGHTANPVPFIIASDKYRGVRLKQGTLLDVAATMAKILGKRFKLDGKPLF